MEGDSVVVGTAMPEESRTIFSTIGMAIPVPISIIPIIKTVIRSFFLFSILKNPLSCDKSSMEDSLNLRIR